jgi:tetratricopeptide (TPR) repeat protein
MEMRREIIKMLERANGIEQGVVSSISEEERSMSSSYNDWSIKDQIAHCAAWKDRLARNISAVLEGLSPTRSEDVDRENKEIFYEFAGKPWEDVLAYAEQSYFALIEAVQNVSKEDLYVMEFLPWQSGRELWKVFLGTGYTHPLTHLSQMHLKRGNLRQARDIQEEMSQSLLALDESPSWQSIAIYNLACFYALSGEKAKAIEDLKEALRLNPTLMDWSKQDPDFDSIREDPKFSAIYDSP